MWIILCDLLFNFKVNNIYKNKFELLYAIKTKEAPERMRAINGVHGYPGTENGLGNLGAFLRNWSNESMAIKYRVKAPITETVIISAVLFVNNAAIPIPILTSSALAGVKNLGCNFPKNRGAKPFNPNSEQHKVFLADLYQKILVLEKKLEIQF